MSKVWELALGWQSFKILEEISKDKSHEKTSRAGEYLRLWSCIALLRLFEGYPERFVQIIPFYGTFKFVLISYLMLSRSNTFIQHLFDDFITPVFDYFDYWIERFRIVVNDRMLDSLEDIQDTTWKNQVQNLSKAELYQWKSFLQATLRRM